MVRRLDKEVAKMYTDNVGVYHEDTEHPPSNKEEPPGSKERQMATSKNTRCGAGSTISTPWVLCSFILHGRNNHRIPYFDDRVNAVFHNRSINNLLGLENNS